MLPQLEPLRMMLDSAHEIAADYSTAATHRPPPLRTGGSVHIASTAAVRRLTEAMRVADAAGLGTCDGRVRTAANVNRRTLFC